MPDTVDQMDKTVAEAVKPPDASEKNNYYKQTLSYGLAIAGGVAGILVAVHRKSGFWGGVGWFLLLNTAGFAGGYLAGTVLDGKPK